VKKESKPIAANKYTIIIYNSAEWKIKEILKTEMTERKLSDREHYLIVRGVCKES
jgi:hypothetical protein